MAKKSAYLKAAFRQNHAIAPSLRKKWYPGYYLYVTGNGESGMPAEGSSGDINGRQLVSANPNWVGYFARYGWQTLESAPGVYDFSQIRSDLDRTKADGKRFAIGLETKDTTNTYFPGPPYMNPVDAGFIESYAGAFYEEDQSGGTSGKIKYLPARFRVDYTDRLTAIISALGAEFDGDEDVSFISLQETANPGIELQPGYSPEGLLAHYLSVFAAAQNAFPRTTLNQIVNWRGGLSSTQADELMASLAGIQGSFGATDIWGRISSATADVKMTENAFGKYYSMYRGIMPIIAHAQTPTFNTGTAQRDVEFALDEGANMQVWVAQRGLVVQTAYTIYDVIDYVDSINGRTNSTPPSALLA
jgi:hypothetical protein